MILLISNHDAEIDVFSSPTHAVTANLQVVDNNLSALTLLASGTSQCGAIVVTNHQDERINIDTQTFVCKVASDYTTEIILVQPLLTDVSETTALVVDTIEEALSIVLNFEQHYRRPNVVATFSPTNQICADISQHGMLVPLDKQSSFDKGAPDLEFSDQGAQSATSPQDDREPKCLLLDDIRASTAPCETQDVQPLIVTQIKTLFDRLAFRFQVSRARLEEAQLDQIIQAPRLTRCHTIAVISPKGGVGKSFLTYLVGNFLSDVRGDKIIALDANPDFGTLADQIRNREQQTIETLLEQLPNIRHYTDMRQFTTKVASRLEVLAAAAEPNVMMNLTAQDYETICRCMQHYYDCTLLDCGTNFRDSVTKFALKHSDQVLLVSTPSVITTRLVVRTLGYLEKMGCSLDRVTLVVNQVRRQDMLALNELQSTIGSELNAIVVVPFDNQLSHDIDHGEFDINRTQRATRVGVKRLIAEMARHFS